MYAQSRLKTSAEPGEEAKQARTGFAVLKL